jgi:5-methylthioadenosine/S-adenosylhomocysteine deaminase
MTESLMLSNALVLNPGEQPFRACILTEGCLMAAVERVAVPAAGRVIDASDKIVIPGLVNAHTHGHGSLGKGLGDKWTLELLLNASAWTSGGFTMEDRYLAAKLNAAELILSGATAAFDMFVQIPSPDPEALEAVARGYEEVGVRLVLAPMIADLSFYDAVPGLAQMLPDAARAALAAAPPSPAEYQLQQLRNWLERFDHDRDRVRPALGPTIPTHCSDEFLVGCRELADRDGLSIQMHLAESKPQVVAGRRVYGTSLVARLARHGLLGPRFVGAHGVWLDDEDLAVLADSGASLVHNPGSNLRLGCGIARARAMRDRGIPLGLGSDGSVSSDNQNMFEAMRLASYVSRALSPDPDDWLSAAEAFAMATVEGARVLGFGDRLGRIAPGYLADLTLLDAGAVAFTPLNDPLLQLVQAADSAAVHTVIANGRVVLEARRFTRLDYPALRRDCEAAVARMRDRTVAPRKFSEALAGVVSRHCVGLAREPVGFDRYCGC